MRLFIFSAVSLVMSFNMGNALASGPDAKLPEVSMDSSDRILSGHASSSCAASSAVSQPVASSGIDPATLTLAKINSLKIPLDIFENHPAKELFAKSNFFVEYMKHAVGLRDTYERENDSRLEFMMRQIKFVDTMRAHWRQEGIKKLKEAKIPATTLNNPPPRFDLENGTPEQLADLLVPLDLFDDHPAQDDFAKSNAVILAVRKLVEQRAKLKADSERVGNSSDPSAVNLRAKAPSLLAESKKLLEGFEKQRAYWRKSGIRKVHGLPATREKPPASLEPTISSSSAVSSGAAASAPSSASSSAAAPVVSAGSGNSSENNQSLKKSENPSPSSASSSAPNAQVKQGWRAWFRTLGSKVSRFFSSCWKNAGRAFLCLCPRGPIH